MAVAVSQKGGNKHLGSRSSSRDGEEDIDVGRSRIHGNS